VDQNEPQEPNQVEEKKQEIEVVSSKDSLEDKVKLNHMHMVTAVSSLLEEYVRKKAELDTIIKNSKQLVEENEIAFKNAQKYIKIF
jgi:hypothetical protein